MGMPARRALLILALLAGQAVVSAAPALAASPGTVTRSGSTLIFTAGASTANNVLVSTSGSNFAFQDAAAPITPGAGSGCVNSGANKVLCVAAGIASLSIVVLDLSDRVELAWFANGVTVPATLSGGNGNDLLIGGAGKDNVNGEGNDDTLVGGPGNDSVNGGGGSDTFTEHDSSCDGCGADSYNGGTGTDRMFYYGTGTSWVQVRLDNVNNDGLFGTAGDNVHDDIEQIFGTSGTSHGDVLVGSAAANLIMARSGPDYVDGGGGNDSVTGEDGNDTLLGSGGADSLDGGAGADTINGGDGDDSLFGGPDFDALNGGPGTDACDIGTGGGTEVSCEL